MNTLNWDNQSINVLDILFECHINKTDEYNILKHFDTFKCKQTNIIKTGGLVSFKFVFKKYKIIKYTKYNLVKDYHGVITYINNEFIYQFYTDMHIYNEILLKQINSYLSELIFQTDKISFEKLKLLY